MSISIECLSSSVFVYVTDFLTSNLSVYFWNRNQEDRLQQEGINLLKGQSMANEREAWMQCILKKAWVAENGIPMATNQRSSLMQHMQYISDAF